MNFVLIMTDTQNKSMVGAYGRPEVDTPNRDRPAGFPFETPSLEATGRLTGGATSPD